MKAFVDYYSSNKIIPVHQDIPDMRVHFNRRSGLFRQLGIPYRSITGRKFLELGPGTGQNALFTLACQPAKLVMVDANQASIDATADNLRQYEDLTTDISLIKSTIEDFDPTESYDFVLCEGVLPFQNDPVSLLTKISKLVAPGGVLIVTSVDPISYFPEVLRRSLKPIVDGIAIKNKQSQLSTMVDFFASDLDSLKGMSRRHEDWIQDVILHPYRGGKLLPISEVIGHLADEFDIQGASPNFLTDWRWYKQIIDDDPGANAQALRCYASYGPAFLDYRVEPTALQNVDTQLLLDLCADAFDCHFDAWDGCSAAMSRLSKIAQDITNLIQLPLPMTADSIRDWCRVKNELEKGNWCTFDKFSGYFGRGQQYLSFVRRQHWCVGF